MKRMMKVFYALAAALFCSPVLAAPVEIFRLEIPARVGAEVRAVRPDGSAAVLGKVTLVPTGTKYPGYTASAWAQPGTVAATAVNALHMTVAVEKEHGRIVSILPSETIAPAAGGTASFIVDCPAGTGLFGGWAPPVGSQVRVRRADGSLRYLSAAKMPQPDETLVISVGEDREWPYMFDFENRVGGAVTAYYTHRREVIARVEHPVTGSGRFSGGKFQRRSALRANHCGVICVSTSNWGDIGGFQIIPYEHAFSKEMKHAWDSPQWMIVRSADGEKLTGRSPLFSGCLVPGTQAREKLWNFWSTYGRKSLLLCRYGGGDWRRFDPAAGKDDRAFEDVTHIRVYVPTTREPLKD